MVLDTNISIALKNSFGQYDIQRFTLFQMDTVNQKFKNLYIKKCEDGDIFIKVKCPLCEKNHFYKYNLFELMSFETVIGGCMELGIPIFYIGKSKNVDVKIEKQMDINRIFYSMIQV